MVTNDSLSWISSSLNLQEDRPRKAEDTHTGMTLEDYLDQLADDEREADSKR